MTVKRCSKCHETKALEAFYRRASSSDSRHSWCKSCKRAKDAAAHEKNRDRRLAATREWKTRNPDKVQAANERRRVRLAEAGGGVFDGRRKDYQDVIAFYQGLCGYCLVRPFEVLDHKVPVTRGGTNHAENIMPACETCNLKKHTKIFPSEWGSP